MDYQDIWKPNRLALDETFRLQLGPLDVWVHRSEHEWLMASKPDAGDENRLSLEKLDSMPDCEWTRWVINEPVEEITFKPRMPDRPLIVRPEMPVCLLPNQSVQFYIGVPIWLSLTLGTRFPDIMEVPAMRLSNSWFGPLSDGELCYAMRTTAKVRQQDLQEQPHRAVVPFEIRNMSNERLDFERLCLHTRHLQVYQGKIRMWTNQGRISYRGEEKWSRVVYARGAPPFDDAQKMLCKAREPASRGALLRTFGDWKTLVDF